MANFSPSNLVAGQAIFSEKFQSGEWKMPDVAAFQTAVTGGIANPMLMELRTREDRAVNAYFPIRQTATNGTARAHNHSGARPDSLSESITWTTFSEPFSISMKMADNNVFSLETMFATGLRNAIYNLNNRIDAYFVTQLLADKTQAAVAGGDGNFNTTADDYQVASANGDFFFQNVKAFLDQNLYRGMLTGIVDSRGTVLKERLMSQGAANDENTAFQFMGFDRIMSSTRTILAAGTYTQSGIFFETGLVAMIPWIPKQNRKPLDPEKAMTYVGDYGQISVPELGVDYAIHAYADRADTTASNGRTQDVEQYFEVSVDMAYASAPLSTFGGTNQSVVHTAGVLT